MWTLVASSMSVSYCGRLNKKSGCHGRRALVRHSNYPARLHEDVVAKHTWLFVRPSLACVFRRGVCGGGGAFLAHGGLHLNSRSEVNISGWLLWLQVLCVEASSAVFLLFGILAFLD